MDCFVLILHDVLLRIRVFAGFGVCHPSDSRIGNYNHRPLVSDLRKKAETDDLSPCTLISEEW